MLEEIKETEEIIEKKLTFEEMKVIELFNEKIKSNRAELENLRLKAEVSRLKAKSLDLEARLLEKDILAKIESNGNDLKKHKSYINELKVKLQIETDKFGYDPDTGVVIL